MIPVLTEDQLKSIRSRAEARLYVACRDQLEDALTVIYSSNWLYRDDRNLLKEGEADFLIVDPKSGLFILEVKGGGVQFDPRRGRWFSTDRSGQRHEIKDPFRQASNERHAILDQLQGHAAWKRWGGCDLTIGHAVAFPDIADVSQLLGPDRPRSSIACADDVAGLEKWFAHLVRFWRRDRDEPLGPNGVTIVEQILCKPIDVKPVLRGTVEEIERARIRLTANQARILRIIGGRNRAVISGGAGTGKTLIAIERARQFAADGLRVLFLCYNRPLADVISMSVSGEPLIEVLTFHQLCDRRIRIANSRSGRDVLAEAQESYPGTTDDHYFNVQLPFALALANELVEEKYDAVVVDEAQDFSDEYWFAIEELLADADTGRLYIFIDPNQRLYRRHANLPVPGEPFHLTANCRNTSQIHNVGYAYYSGQPVDPPELSGVDVKQVAVDGDIDQANQIVQVLCGWINDAGLSPEDACVLVAKRPKEYSYDLLKNTSKGTGLNLTFEGGTKARRILVETVARFKGLEATAAVLWVGDDLVEEESWESFYVGTTRAKSVLAIIGSRKAISTLAATQGIKRRNEEN